MNWPIAFNTKTRRVFALFALAEITLIFAVPFLAVAGAYSVLESQSGVFVQQVGPDQPGWRAQVEPSSVMVVIHQFEGKTVGVAFAVHKQGVEGGSVALLPSQMKVGGTPIEELTPEAIVDGLVGELKLRIDEMTVVDERTWPSVLGEQNYRIENPDVVPGDQNTGFEVGPVVLNAENISQYLGSKASTVDSTALLVRHTLVWNALIDEPPTADHPLAFRLSQLSGGQVDVFDFSGDLTGRQDLEEEQADELLRRAVPFPAGAAPDHRVRLRLFDRTGSIDLITIAAELGAEGFEVVEMGNIAEFDDGPSEFLVPSDWIGPDTQEVEDYIDLPPLIEEADEAESVATILIGNDFSLISA